MICEPFLVIETDIKGSEVIKIFNVFKVVRAFGYRKL